MGGKPKKGQSFASAMQQTSVKGLPRSLSVILTEWARLVGRFDNQTWLISCQIPFILSFPFSVLSSNELPLYSRHHPRGFNMLSV